MFLFGAPEIGVAEAEAEADTAVVVADREADRAPVVEGMLVGTGVVMVPVSEFVLVIAEGVALVGERVIRVPDFVLPGMTVPLPLAVVGIAP